MTMKIKIKSSQYTRFEGFFLAIWTIYSANYALFTASELPYVYAVNRISSYIAYATIALQLMLLLYKRYPYKKLFTYAIFLFLIFMVEISITDRTFLIYMLFIILGQDIEFEKILKYDIKLKIFLLIIIISLWLLGITDNYMAYSAALGTYKQSIGFSNFNTFTCYALTIMCEWLCIRYKKMKWYEWSIILIGWFLVLQIGGGRASAYTFLFVYFLFFVASKFPNIFYTKFSKFIFIIITPLMCAFSFVMIYLYGKGNALAKSLDEFMTGRFSNASTIINIYGIKLFGQEIDLISSRRAKMTHVNSVVLDNAYARCAVCWGALMLIFIIIMYCILFRKLLNAERIDIALVGIFFVLMGLGESYMLNITYNITLLCLLGTNFLKKGNEEGASATKSRWTVQRRNKNLDATYT